jgi:GntR family transcriptional regulator
MSVPVPKYYLITNILRQTFARYERGDRVPAECELAAQFGVSRVTLQRALAQLVADGIVVRVQGKGTFYAGEGKKGSVQAISGALESLMIYENGASARVLGKSCSREAPPDVRRQLGLGPDEEVVSFKRVAIVDTEPLAYIVNYLPRDIGMKIYDEDEALTFRPIAYLLRERYGISLTRAEQTIDAVLAEPEVASALDFPIGSPLLRIERTLFTRKRRAIQFTRSWYRSDRHKYAVTLSDWGGGSISRKKQGDVTSRQERRGRSGAAGPRPLILG